MYTIQKNGIVYEKITQSPRLGITIHSKIRLPLHMNIEVWRRHKYSYQDIRQTLNTYCCVDLWRLCNILGVQCPLTNVVVSVTFPRYCTLHSRSLSVKKMMTYFKEKHVEFKSNKNVLFTQSTLYTPVLPLHKLSSTYYDILFREVEYITAIGTEILCRSLTIMIDGLPFIALYKNSNSHIYCVRIMLSTEYDELLQYLHCDGKVPLISAPLNIFVGDVLYYGLEEACLFGVHDDDNEITIDIIQHSP